MPWRQGAYICTLWSIEMWVSLGFKPAFAEALEILRHFARDFCTHYTIRNCSKEKFVTVLAQPLRTLATVYFQDVWTEKLIVKGKGSDKNYGYLERKVRSTKDIHEDRNWPLFKCSFQLRWEEHLVTKPSEGLPVLKSTLSLYFVNTIAPEH